MAGPPDAVLLTQLLLALFDRSSELRRFLNLVGLEAVEHQLPQTKDESIRSTAAEVARAAEDLDLVQAPLFEALARRAPERADDIWDVARAYGIESGESEPPGVIEPEPAGDGASIDPRYAEFVEKLDAKLAASVPTAPEDKALSPSRWPWAAAAAVLGSFRPLALRPLPDPAPAADTALTALADVVFTTAGGRWVLDDDVRSRALLRLRDDDALQAAIEANAGLADAHRDWMRRLLAAAEPPRLASLDTRELAVLDTVARWLEPLDLGITLRPAELYAAIERRSLIDPLRKLVGSHFRGRVEELAAIERHLLGDGEEPLMVVWGPGGSGKSSLLGKVLLELEDRIAWAPLSFAYVDFDKARHDPTNPRGLVEQIARQLRLLYATNAEASREFVGLESLSAGTDLDLAAEALDIDAESVKLDIDGLIGEFARRLDAIPRAYPTPLALIFDTFEEVQIRGPGAVEDVRGLVGMLKVALPGIRIVISGRGDMRGHLGSDRALTVTLGDLDAASADAVLESLGVAAPEIRRLICERFGGNPLTLRLAAEAVQRMGTAEEAFAGPLGQADALAAVGIEQIQGMLYDRILGHLGDPEIVRVAQPGLAVRRVDADVIRDVLSAPCGLDPDRAEAIFERLRLEVSMFEADDDGALRHRQDVRRLMLRAMVDDPTSAPVLAEIHRRAVAFYEPRPGRGARAEELYHRLMGGEDLRSLHELWDMELRDSLATALEDPLPAPAKTWLQRRLGLVATGDERADWDHEDWEAEAADRARSWLASGEPARAWEVLSERAHRLPGSRLFTIDVAVLVDLDRLNEAAQVLDAGMRNSIDAHSVETQLELAEQAIRLATRRADAVGIAAAGESAVRLADLTDEPLRGIADLATAAAALQRLGAVMEADRLNAQISSRFAALPTDVLRDNPDVVRRVIQTAGLSDSTVLAQAAMFAGDTISPFRDDAFALGRLLESTVPAGRPAMNRLAVEVGLPEDGWTPRELATSAVRRGRTGEALVVALDYAADEDAARRSIVLQLVGTSPGDDPAGPA
jgi:hypothetical protein